MSSSKFPKYRLTIVDKQNNKRKTKAGVLFEMGDGGFSLVLNPGITLRAEDRDKYWFNVWPIDPKWKDRWHARQQDNPNGEFNQSDIDDDDTPF